MNNKLCNKCQRISSSKSLTQSFRRFKWTSFSSPRKLSTDQMTKFWEIVSQWYWSGNKTMFRKYQKCPGIIGKINVDFYDRSEYSRRTPCISLSEKCLSSTNTSFTTTHLYTNMKPNLSNVVIFILIKENVSYVIL